MRNSDSYFDKHSFQAEAMPFRELKSNLCRYPHLAGQEIFYRVSPGPVVPWGDRSKCFDSVLLNVRAGAFGVADASGHPSGGIPSLVAVRAAEQSLLRDLDAEEDFFSIAPEKIFQVLFGAFREANFAVWRRGMQIRFERGDDRNEDSVFETTMTLVIVRGSQYYVGHVGDSFAVLVPPIEPAEAPSSFAKRKSATSVLTRNDSVLAQDVYHRTLKEGEAFRDAAAQHYAGRALRRVLGRTKDLAWKDVWLSKGRMDVGDSLIIATDGLLAGRSRGGMREEQFVEQVCRAPSAKAACIELIDEARAAGSSDDIALIVLKNREFTASLLESAPVERRVAIRAVPPLATPRKDSEMPRNMPGLTPWFTGREDVLSQIHDHFEGLKGAPKSCLLFGMSGSGKTQLAVKYARDFPHKGPVFWIDAEDDQQVEASLRGVAALFNLSHLGDLRDVIDAVRFKLTQSEGFLLVIDNAEEATFHDNKLLTKLLFGESSPTTGRTVDLGSGDILITARYENCAAFADFKSQTAMLSPEESIELLLRSAGKDGGQGVDMSAVDEVATELGWYPLGLAIAGHFVGCENISFNSYLDLLRRCPASLPGDDNMAAAIGAPRSALAAMSLTWSLIVAKHESAAKLFQFFASLAPDDLPLDSVFEHAGVWAKGLGLTDDQATTQSLTDKNAFGDKFIGPMTMLSLATVDGGKLSMHRLVKEFVWSQITDDHKKLLVKSAIDFCKKVLGVGPSCEASTKSSPVMIPHLVAAISRGCQLGVAMPEDRLTLAIRCDSSGDFSRAIELASEVRNEVPEEAIARGQRDALQVYIVATVRLASFYEHLKKYCRALELLELLEQMYFDGCCPLQKGGELREEFLWARYHRGIIQSRLGRYRTATDVLQEISGSDENLPHSRFSADHHLAVVDLELGRWLRALEGFMANMTPERQAPGFRRGYAYRRAAQAESLLAAQARGRNEEGLARALEAQAQADIEEARRISQECFNLRYVKECAGDEQSFFRWPAILRSHRQSVYTMQDLAALLVRADLQEELLADVFRVLTAEGIVYRAELFPETKSATNRLIRADELRRPDSGVAYWYGAVAVIVTDEHGNVALRKPGGVASEAPWDISVEGDVAIGERDESCAVRETYQVLGQLTDPEDFRRLGERFSFRQCGGPNFAAQRSAEADEYRFDAAAVCHKLISLFSLEVQRQELAEADSASVAWRDPEELAADIRRHPRSFSASVRQFVGQIERIRQSRRLEPRRPTWR